jgi:hypothetical protein
MTKQDIQQVAERYRADGYNVVVAPHHGQLPPFAAGFGADLLATRPDGSVLVQVRETRESLRRDQELSRAAEVTNAQPGWRFDLVILHPDPSEEKGVADAAEPSIEQLHRLLDQADESARIASWTVSYVSAWAGLEAVIRRFAKAAGVDLPSVSPRVMIRTLYAFGHLTPEEFRRLERSLNIRQAFAHGFILPNVKEAIEEAPATFVTSVARRLLAEEEKARTHDPKDEGGQQIGA